MAGVDKQQAGSEVVNRIAHIIGIATELRAQRLQVLQKQRFIIVVAGDQIQGVVQAAEDLAGDLILLRTAAVDDIAAHHHRIRAFAQRVKLRNHISIGGIDVDKAIQLLAAAAEMGIGNVR